MSFQPTLAVRTAVEDYLIDLAGGTIDRSVARRDGSVSRSSLQIVGTAAALDTSNPHALFDKAWLRASGVPSAGPSAGEVRVVDLFAGCGGLSLGVAEACRALGLRMISVAANDIEAPILDIYRRNFPTAEILQGPVQEVLLDGECGAPLTELEQEAKQRLEARGAINMVIGGPPCQGHSNFNNHTRHNDPKNELYLRMARFCEVFRPDHVIIENVPGVERDRTRSAARTREWLERLGYQWNSGVIDASDLGVAQRRKRSITIASRVTEPSVVEAIADISIPEERSLSWAIGDLTHVSRDSIMDEVPNMSAANQARVDYLHDHHLYDLPDSQRPDCHRLKDHRYQAVYGRLYADRAAPTITTGFGCLGRGRFGHPDQRRTITLHEAARIQFFPDFFDFGPGPRTLIQKVIGNAVPPKLGYVLGLHLLR